MQFFTSATISAIAISALAQGSLGRSFIKRADPNALAMSECHADAQNANITVTSQGSGTYTVSGLPATCMTVATIITGTANVGNPVPQGVDSIQYSGISDATINQIENAFKGVSS